MNSHPYKVRAVVPLVFALLVPLALAAQDDEKKEPGGIPTFTGKGKVKQAIDMDKGAIFDIGGGITLLFPKGLPVGHSRLLTLTYSRKRPKPSQIHRKFKPLGKPMVLDSALNAGRTPMVLSMKMKKAPRKAGYKLVLAMEQAGFCDDSNKKYKIGKSGLCSTWQTVDAEYDSMGERVVVKLQSTGGLRMQFGWIPESDE